MSTSRRVKYAVCGSAGAAVAAFAVWSNYGAYRMYYAGAEFYRVVITAGDWTVPGYLLAAVSFYVLAAAVGCGRLRSRRWPVYAVAALTLASVLVGGTAVYHATHAPARYYGP